MYANKHLSNVNSTQSEIRQKYKVKCSKLRKYMRFIIYVSTVPTELDSHFFTFRKLINGQNLQENTALCDQITYLQDKILYTKEENNFLARKLQYMEFIKNSTGIPLGALVMVLRNSMYTIKKRSIFRCN